MRRTLLLLPLLIVGCHKAETPAPVPAPIAQAAPAAEKAEPPKDSGRVTDTQNPKWRKVMRLMGETLIDMNRPKAERTITPEQAIEKIDEAERSYHEAYAEGIVSDADNAKVAPLFKQAKAFALEARAKALEEQAKREADAVAQRERERIEAEKKAEAQAAKPSAAPAPGSEVPGS
jgi:hypothetical protein